MGRLLVSSTISWIASEQSGLDGCSTIPLVHLRPSVLAMLRAHCRLYRLQVALFDDQGQEQSRRHHPGLDGVHRPVQGGDAE